MIDYRDSDYLNTAMKETQENYQRCLDGLGFPHNLTGDQGKEITATFSQVEVAEADAELENLKSRSCGVIGRYLGQCQPVLARCLTSPSQELVRSRDAAWLVSQLALNIREMNPAFSLAVYDRTFPCMEAGSQLSLCHKEPARINQNIPSNGFQSL